MSCNQHIDTMFSQASICCIILFNNSLHVLGQVIHWKRKF